MNMNKALQNLYHAVSGQTTTKRNISKLLLDIHYAVTGKQSANKNNWSRIIDSMATNWSGGGGGGGDSDFSTANVTLTLTAGARLYLPFYNPIFFEADEYDEGFPALASVNMDVVAKEETKTVPIILYKGYALLMFDEPIKNSTTISGDCEFPGEYGNMVLIWGDCSIITG